MNSYTKFFTIIFITIWVLAMSSGVIRGIYFKKYTKPYLDLHATETAILFYKTCISSGVNLEKLEKNAILAHMVPAKDLTVSSNIFGLKKIHGKWEMKAMENTKKDWKYKAFPYELSLREVEYRGSNVYALPKTLCQMSMHSGVMKVPSRPYYIPRESYHSDYRRYLGKLLLWMLKQGGAELIDAPRWGSVRYNLTQPMSYTLDGKKYHLKVDAFSITLELAEEIDCITCDLYPQPEVARKSTKTQ